MADVRYLQQQAEACKQAARQAGDPRECEDLMGLAVLYERQVEQLKRRRAQVQA